MQLNVLKRPGEGQEALEGKKETDSRVLALRDRSESTQLIFLASSSSGTSKWDGEACSAWCFLEVLCLSLYGSSLKVPSKASAKASTLEATLRHLKGASKASKAP